jgi:hypothetical protein
MSNREKTRFVHSKENSVEQMRKMLHEWMCLKRFVFLGRRKKLYLKFQCGVLLTRYGSLRDAVCEESAPGGRFVARPGPQRGEPCRVHRRNLRQFAALSDSLSGAAALWALKTTRQHPLIYVRRRSQPVAHLPLSGVEKFKHTALVISQRARQREKTTIQPH